MIGRAGSRAFLWLTAAALSSAPSWLPSLEPALAEWIRRSAATPVAESLHWNLKIRAPILALTGAALAGSLLSARWCPDGWVRAAVTIFRTAGKRPFVTGAALASGLLAGLLAVNRHVLHSFPGSADEFSCFFLAECIRMGRWFAEPPPLDGFFETGHVCVLAGKWFSVYPPGWPLLLAGALAGGFEDALNPILTVCSLVVFYLSGRRLFGSAASALGTLLTAASPFLLFTGASYYSHGSSLFFICVFLYAFVRWRDAASARSQTAWAALAALAMGCGFLTRYWTAVAVCAPFVLSRVVSTEGKRKASRTSDVVFYLLLGLLASAAALHNQLLTGDPTVFPNQAGVARSAERLGFSADYTALDAWIYLTARFFYLTHWFPATWLAAYAVSLSRRGALDGIRGLTRLGFLYPVAAYFFYYSWGGSQFGPRYYYEGIPFLGLAVGDWLVVRWREGAPAVRRFLLGLFVCSLAVSAALLYNQIRWIRAAYGERQALYAEARRVIREPAVVFVRGPLGEKLPMSRHDVARNHPSLQGRILYVNDLGVRNPELMRRYPDRKFYRGSFDPATARPRLEAL